MGKDTKIEWTDATWNPIIGCSRVSEGCRHCYAETIAGRFGRGKPTVYSELTQIVNGHAVWTGKIKETKQLLQPLSWKTPKRVFVNSMSDLFHENVTDEMRDRIFAVMALCPQHTFQVLTKRPERMLEYFNSGAYANVQLKACDLAREWLGKNGAQGFTLRFRNMGLSLARHSEVVRADFDWPLANVWLGVSVENQAAADERIPLLLQTPAAVRFISAEPLLGPVDLTKTATTTDLFRDVLRGVMYDDHLEGEYGGHLDWVICGGESGPGARPMHPDWARGLRDQCETAGVPFFFKQWGAWLPALQDGAANLNCSDHPIKIGKKLSGNLLDGKVWQNFPEAR